MTRKEREAFAKTLYEEYMDNEDGQISQESLSYKYGKSQSTICRLINQHKALVEGTS